MVFPKVYSISSVLWVLHWCTYSMVLSYTDSQIPANLEGSNAQIYFGDEKLRLPTFEEQSINCISSKKDNEKYSSSFTELDEDFSILQNPNQVIKETCIPSNNEETNGTQFNEAITLCWIERIIIKEDLSYEPLKRLVFREYAISFENSATIPEDYLDCKKIKGEISSNDGNVDKTVFYEIIDEDTKVSRIVNFTRLKNENGIRIWQHKSVKCGMGSVVSRSLKEWDIASKNPKKRLEIKVGPRIRTLKTTFDKTKLVRDSMTSIETSEGNVSDKVIGRMLFDNINNNYNEFHDKDLKSDEFIKQTTEFSDHLATDETEVMKIVDQTTVSQIDEISSTVWKNVNQTKSQILPHQRFVLRIKLALEHTNEKEDKESLIEVEKNVVLTGNEARFGQPDFLEQIRALNRSINLEVIEALFNYTSLGELSKSNNISWVTEPSPRIKKRSNNEEEKMHSEKTVEEVHFYANTTESRMTDDSWLNQIGYNFPDIYEDVITGLNEMFSIFTSANDSSTSKLFDNIENVNLKKSYIRKKRNFMKEIGRWWKERTDQIYTNIHIRSTTELTLYEIE